MVAVDVERYDAKVVRGGDLDNVGEAHLGCVASTKHEVAQEV